MHGQTAPDGCQDHRTTRSPEGDRRLIALHVDNALNRHRLRFMLPDDVGEFFMKRKQAAGGWQCAPFRMTPKCGASDFCFVASRARRSQLHAAPDQQRRSFRGPLSSNSFILARTVEVSKSESWPIRGPKHDRRRRWPAPKLGVRRAKEQQTRDARRGREMGNSAVMSDEQCTLGEDCAKQRKRQAFQNRLTFRGFGQLHTRKLTGVALSPNDKQVTDARIVKHFPLHLEPASKGPILSLTSTARMDRHERPGQCLRAWLAPRRDLG